MIRAVVWNGGIRPLDPLPPGWQDGHEVLIEDSAEPAEDIDRWMADMHSLTADLADLEEWQTIEAHLAEADRQAKANVRQQMGLS